MKQERSEFGKGLAYNLGLFLAHAERFRFEELAYTLSIRDANVLAEQKARSPHIWFNGASDHLYDLRIRDAPTKLRSRLKDFRAKCLAFGHGCEVKPTEDNVYWAVKEAKELLLALDNAHGVKTMPAEFD